MPAASQRALGAVVVLALLGVLVATTAMWRSFVEIPATCVSPVPMVTEVPPMAPKLGYILDLKTQRLNRLQAQWISYKYDIQVLQVAYKMLSIPHVSDEKIEQLRCSRLLRSVSHVIPADVLQS
jgi:hypothetical protein